MNSSKKPTSNQFRKIFYRIATIIVIALAITDLTLIILSHKDIKIDLPKKSTHVTLDIPKNPIVSEFPIKNKNTPDPYIQARRVALIDVDSGTLLYGHNQDERVPIASDTKIMTATVILKKFDLSDIVTVTKIAANINGSVMGLKEGEKITTLSLLNGLLLPSGNDAAFALAEHYGGVLKPGTTGEEAIQAFVDAMNKKAKELDMKDTDYLNPAGLDDNALSTARDQGHLMAYALKNETFATIVHKPNTTVTSTDGKIVHNLDSSNRLVTQEMYYDGIIGGKTGFTPVAGHNLIAEADRDGRKLVAVVFSTNSLAPNASAIQVRDLLNWGYDNFTWKKI